MRLRSGNLKLLPEVQAQWDEDYSSDYEGLALVWVGSSA